MKVTGGSFGIGKARFNTDKSITVKAAKEVTFTKQDIKLSSILETKEKKFGAIGFILGAILLSAILVAFVGPLGILIGVIVAALGSFYSKKLYTAEVELNTGEKILFAGDKYELSLLLI